MKNVLRCAIYTRVSTDQQAEVEFNSCEAQEERIRSFIHSQENMSVFKIYSDPGFTGANIDRPALQMLLKDVQDKKIDLVIVYKIDRLTRSPKDFYSLIERFDQHKVDFLSVTERFDTSTPSGRLLRNIMLTFAQFERELVSERVKDKMLQRAYKGLWNGGGIPFGYQIQNKKLIIEPKEAKIVQLIFEDYIENHSISKIYEDLRNKGITRQSGNPLSKSNISYLLRNVIYTGKLVYSGKTYQGTHPPIISEELFETAQSSHKEWTRNLRTYKNYLFSGLIQCIHCGTFMTPCHTNKLKEGKRKRYYYYRCTKTYKHQWNDCPTRQVNANKVEDYIINNLERIAQDRHYIESSIFYWKNQQPGHRMGLEPTFESSKITPQIFEQTLLELCEGLRNRPSVDKNLWAQKRIKSILYDKDHIQIQLCLTTGKVFLGLNSKAAPPLAGPPLAVSKDVTPSEGRPNPAGRQNDKIGCGNSDGSNCFPIILPNTIHACKKRV